MEVIPGLRRLDLVFRERFEAGQHFGRGLETVFRLLRHGLGKEFLHRVGELGPEPADVGHFLVFLLVHDGQRGLAHEGQASGQHVIVGGAKGIGVGPGVRLLTFALLGRHEVRRAHDGAGLGDVGHGLHCLCEPKVRDLDAAVVAQEDVVGFDIAVDQAILLRGLERVRHADGNVGGPVERQAAAARHHLLKAFARHVLHLDEIGVLGAAHIVDQHDVGVVQPRGRPSFAQKTVHVDLVAVHQLRREDLQRARAVQLQMLRFVYRAHAALADHFENAVLLDGLAHHLVLPLRALLPRIVLQRVRLLLAVLGLRLRERLDALGTPVRLAGHGPAHPVLDVAPSTL